MTLTARLLGATMLAAMLAAPAAAETRHVFIGTYTPDPAASGRAAGGGGHGEGIYYADVDSATGAISHVKLAAKTLSPSWLAVSADGKFLYAVNEIDTYGRNKSGSVTAFAVGAGGSLKQLNAVDSGGSIPCFISIDPSKKFVLVADYTGGAYSVIRLKADGSLGETTDVVKPDGPMSSYNAADRPPGMFPDKSEHGTRGHMILADPSGQYVIGADAGRNQIFVWKLDANGKLNQVSVTPVPTGEAPRHFAFSPDGKTMYQLFEQTSRLGAFDFKDGKLTARGPRVSALPDGYEGSNTGSELLINKDGTRLYFANRFEDSIAVFSTAGGALKRIANVHTEGDLPRSLTLDPAGKFIYSLNQTAGNVTAFSIGADGVPKFTGKFVGLGSPAAMVFVK